MSAHSEPDRRGPTPLYHQIYLVLRDRIVSGAYPHGTLLPGEKELTDLYSVSRITAKRALNELAADGFVRRERGRGTRVDWQRGQPPLRSSVEGLYESLLRMGRETTARVVSFGYVPAPDEVADALALAPGTRVQQSHRIRSVDGAPFSHLSTWIPEDIGRSFSAGDLGREPLLTLMERAGVTVTAADQTVSARLAGSEVAAHLEVDLGSALLEVTRTVRDQHDRPVEHLVALYRPDRYQIDMALERVEAADSGSAEHRWTPRPAA